MIFKNSKFEQSRQHVIWFGKKVPPKRRFNARGAAKQAQDESEQAGEFTIAHCKGILLEIELTYTNTLETQDKEWDELSKRQKWQTELKKAQSISDLMELMLELNDGMSLPTSLI